MKDDYISEISILMCIYKEDNPKFLVNALDSLRVQSTFFYELIIVQDGNLNSELKNVIKKFHLTKYKKM